MEKIKVIPKLITNKVTNKGVTYWVVESNDGKKATIWDKEIAKTWEDNLGKEVEINLNVNAAGFGNIRGITPMGQILKEVQQGERSLNGHLQLSVGNEREQLSVSQERGNSIIAQCLVKAVLRNKMGATVKEAVDMYKEALELLR